jgi:hypothetical protein
MKRSSPGSAEIVGTPAVAAENERAELVQRVVKSPRFQRSPKLKDFFLFVCERSVMGPPGSIHEQQIGHSVYGRRPDYDTGEDNIVRVEARRLRRELDAFFVAEGSAEPVVITIPKGGYVPLFLQREKLDETPVPPAPAPVRSSRHWLVIGAAGGLGLMLGLLWWFEFARVRSREPEHQAAESVGVWPLVLKPGTRTVVVVADGALAAVQDISGLSVPLDDYASRHYPANLQKPELQLFARRQLTGMASVLFVSRIVHLNGGRLDNILIRHPSAVSVRDFQKDNHVLLGSRYSNPWVALFRDKRNFDLQFIGDPAQACYQNRSPRTGEPPAYCGSASSGEQYGVVAFLPNLSQSGNVLMIEGTTAEGTEAAWEFLSSGNRFADFVRRNHLDKGGKIPYFELVLRAVTHGGAPVESICVSHRTLEATD